MKKNENYLKYVQAMRLMNEGKSITFLEKNLKMSRFTVKQIRKRYLSGGELALLQPEYSPHHSVSHKLKAVQDIEKNKLSLSEAGLRYDSSPRTIASWLKAYREKGEAGLNRKNRAEGMQKKRLRTVAEMDELEMLRKRNEYLEAENALLKKVKALVEEREARLRAIGRKPSKN
ncbi:MAG: helix-turn-helix domain-containing protein [Bacteroidales bacterium]|nr:helix-turn-helix domain-containing protein [Bacteroidales bacterium]